MARIERRCTRCGAFDDRESWSSGEEASSKGAFDKPWTCTTCAWTEFDLEDKDAQQAKEPATSA